MDVAGANTLPSIAPYTQPLLWPHRSRGFNWNRSLEKPAPPFLLAASRRSAVDWRANPGSIYCGPIGPTPSDFLLWLIGERELFWQLPIEIACPTQGGCHAPSHIPGRKPLQILRFDRPQLVN